MGNGAVALIAAALTAVAVMLIVWLISFIRRFNSDTEYYYWKMQTADTKKEYRRWRREIRCHYLCLIPFVNNKNVMRLYNRIYRKKIAAEAAEDEREADNGITRMIIPSLVGIFACAACLCSASWAWFTSANSGSVATIKTAEKYELICSVTDGEGNHIAPESGEYLLENGSYTVQAEAVGSDYSTGYFVVKYGDKTKYSVQIPAKGTLIFTLSVADFDGKCSITIEPKWGTSSVGQRDIDKDSVLEVR